MIPTLLTPHHVKNARLKNAKQLAEDKLTNPESGKLTRTPIKIIAFVHCGVEHVFCSLFFGISNCAVQLIIKN